MQQLKHSSRRTWIWLVIILIVFLLVSYTIVSKQPKDYPAYLSISPAPSGVKAIFTYLEQENSEVTRWDYKPSKLPSVNDNNLLVMLEPLFVPETEEMEDYIQFMEAGNTVLLFQHNPGGMFEVKTKQVEPSNREYENITDKHGNKYKANLKSNVGIVAQEEDTILFQHNDIPVAIERSYGKGSLIIVNNPDWIVNSSLLNGDHLSIVLSLLQIEQTDWERILFDEYLHDQQHNVDFQSLYPMWFLLVLLQGGTVSVFYLWMRGKRFGPVISPREEFVRFSDEGIRALAAWFIRGRKYTYALGIQADYLKTIIQDHIGIPYHRDWIEIVDQFDHKVQTISKKEINEFLIGLKKVLEKEKISKQEFLYWSKKIDYVRKEVEDK